MRFRRNKKKIIKDLEYILKIRNEEIDILQDRAFILKEKNKNLFSMYTIMKDRMNYLEGRDEFG